MDQGTFPPWASLRRCRQVSLLAHVMSENNTLTLVPCSRQAIQKYIKANNELGNPTDAMFKSRVNAAIRKGFESGDFSFPKGMSFCSAYRRVAIVFDASS